MAQTVAAHHLSNYSNLLVGQSRSDAYLTTILAIAIFYPFIPFSLVGRHEIMPWYLLVILITSIKDRYALTLCLTSMLLIFGVFATAILFGFKLKTASDASQIFTVVLSLFLFAKIPMHKLKFVENKIFKYTILVVLFMLCQKLFPEYMEGITNSITQRNMPGVDLRTGGVRGIAPEPAYMGALLISFFMFSWWVRGSIELNRLLVYIAGIFLTSSLSAIVTISFLLSFQFIYRVIFFRDIEFYGIRSMLLVAFLAITGIIFYLPNFESGISRINVFMVSALPHIMSLDINGFLMAEQQFGSDRLISLANPLTSWCCGYFFTGNYDPSYSLYGKVWGFFAPIHFFIILYFIITKKLSPIRMVSLCLSLFYGPVLFFLLFIGFLNPRRTEHPIKQ
ncbi:MAG: hypothetical protein ABW168_01435 [Sedimenticola sp.]